VEPSMVLRHGCKLHFAHRLPAVRQEGGDFARLRAESAQAR
jgi:hypothetical protein